MSATESRLLTVQRQASSTTALTRFFFVLDVFRIDGAHLKSGYEFRTLWKTSSSTAVVRALSMAHIEAVSTSVTTSALASWAQQLNCHRCRSRPNQKASTTKSEQRPSPDSSCTYSSDAHGHGERRNDSPKTLSRGRPTRNGTVVGDCHCRQICRCNIKASVECFCNKRSLKLCQIGLCGARKCIGFTHICELKLVANLP